MKSSTPHIHHYHRHMSYSYPVSFRQRVYSLVVIPLLFLVAGYFVMQKLGLPQAGVSRLNFGMLGIALLVTFIRLLVAYCIALFLAIPLAILINHSARAERVLLPLFDIIQSVPVLAFFPIVIVLFVHYNFYNGAAIFILLLTMMWSIVFSVVGGLRVIPQDIKAAAKVFGLSGTQYISQILLPAVFPYIVTGSLLAWAGGWNIVIVAEVLHTYIPGGTSAQDLFGIGSVLVNAAASGRQHDFLLAIFGLIILVGVINLVVWQRLLRYAEKFKFE